MFDLSAWLCEPAVRYVAPGSTEDSRLYGVFSGSAARGGGCKPHPGIALTEMAPPGSAYRLPAESARLIAQWIELGAPNN